MNTTNGPSDLVSLAIRSRELLPLAADVLLELFEEVHQFSPNTREFKGLAMFFLMHVCDQFAYEEAVSAPLSLRTEPLVAEIPIWTSAKESVSSLRQNIIRSVLANEVRRVEFNWTQMNIGNKVSRRSRVLARVGSGKASVLVTEPYLKCHRNHEVMAAVRARRWLRWVPEPVFDVNQIDVNLSRRRSLANVDVRSSGLRDSLRLILLLTAPIELLEGFPAIETFVGATLKPHQGVLYTANSYQSQPLYRFWVEKSRSFGARLAVHQHGGGYGIDQFHLGEDFDTSVSDVFYTWGWSRADLDNHTRPLPSALPARGNGVVRKRYLLVSLPVTNHFYRLQAFLTPEHVANAVTETLSFVRLLSSSTDLCIRSSDSAPFPLGKIGGSLANITTDDLSEQCSVAASNSQLVIHNYLGTSWLETMALDVPTVCFYDPTMFSPRVAAQQYLDALARVGVIHYSGAEAARFVNQLQQDPTIWWNSSEVQEAREAFVARYANFSKDWLQAWSDEFGRLVDS